ncbi:Chaperone protein DnaJ 1 [Porphyridium purpureum]|uniref:Chaperone protein DnaJ 1 n=1 Tax=Porphyridium purpureum TaxID=35688 RepID=A0A5J4YPZ7_PORPP|nr:Chaperone protein DnaJ 1 [Porphyridium purpureum]|eukprot:POR6756..scf222_8
MGFSSFCQVCAMPLSHITLLRTSEDNMFRIYRAGESNVGSEWLQNMPVAFGPQHAWLEQVVAIGRGSGGSGDAGAHAQESPIVRGRVDDGDLEDAAGQCVDVEIGLGPEYAAIHERCWLLAGGTYATFSGPQGIETIVRTPEYKHLENTYHEQYFAFETMVERGEDWMLIDPQLASTGEIFQQEAQRNRARIQALIEAGRTYLPSRREVNDNAHDTLSKATSRRTLEEREQEEEALNFGLPPEFSNTYLYGLLDIPRDAQPADIKRAFLLRRKAMHPNAVGGGHPEQWERVQQAYRILSDPNYRAEYDASDMMNVEHKKRFAHGVWKSSFY